MPLEIPKEARPSLTSASQQIPSSRTWEEFENSEFSDDEFDYSSSVYRIQAVKILGQIMNIPRPGFPGDPDIACAEGSISSFHLNLPQQKKEVLRGDGSIDEMLFQAHMIINA
jgi:hypothetical protein